MKIFEKKKVGERRIFYFFGIKFLSYRKKITSTADFGILDYIRNEYGYVLQIPIESNENKESDYVWLYWAQGEENAPDLVKNCLKSVHTYCKDKNIIVLDDNTIENYIDIPDFIKEKYKKNIISKPHFSDYLRTSLLAKYGGTWMDATVLLTDKIPENIMKSDFFVFKPLSWSQCRKVPSIKMLKLLQKIPTYLSRFLCLSSWFIHSKCNNRLMVMTKILFERYWEKENCLIDYFLYHYFVTFLVLYDKKCTEIFNSMPNIANRNPHLLQNALLDEYEEDLFNEIKGLSSIHKLNFKIKNESTKYTFFDEISKQDVALNDRRSETKDRNTTEQ